tara:strand:- start:629 stop:1024 length:396 start_codon:yes stop_codon:yes gene_type:complete
MAKLNGTGGSLDINSNTIDEVEEWSISESAEVVSGAAKGDATVIGEAGIVTRTASVTCFLDPSDTLGQGSITIGATVVLLEFYVNGIASGDDYYTCATAVITSVERTSPMGLAKFVIGIHLNAALVETAVI